MKRFLLLIAVLALSAIAPAAQAKDYVGPPVFCAPDAPAKACIIKLTAGGILTPEAAVDNQATAHETKTQEAVTCADPTSAACNIVRTPGGIDLTPDPLVTSLVTSSVSCADPSSPACSVINVNGVFITPDPLVAPLVSNPE